MHDVRLGLAFVRTSRLAVASVLSLAEKLRTSLAYGRTCRNSVLSRAISARTANALLVVDLRDSRNRGVHIRTREVGHHHRLVDSSSAFTRTDVHRLR